MFFVYVLLSKKDDNFYIGFTPKDVYERFEKHLNGVVPSTKGRRPLELIYFEAHKNELDALKRERYFKTSKGKTTLKQILKNYLNER